MSVALKKAIEKVEDFMLAELLSQLRPDQRAMFDRIYPSGVPRTKTESAIDLCERTIAQNAKRTNFGPRIEPPKEDEG